MAIAITSLGTAANKTLAHRAVIQKSGLSWSAGDLIVVCVASDLPLAFDGPSWPCQVWDPGAHEMVEDVAGNNSGNVSVQVFSWPNVAARSGNGVIQIYNENDSDDEMAVAFTVYAISGIVTSSPLDKSASATGSGTTAGAGPTDPLSQADELGIGAIGMEEQTDEKGTWTTGAGYVSGNDQDAGTTGGGGASNISVFGVAEVLSATTAQEAEQTSTLGNDWAAAVATYKGVAGPPPEGAAVQMMHYARMRRAS